MDRPDLELVLAVRQHGSLVMAARALSVVPSAVTKRLAALEAQLGWRLFQRTTRRVTPTAEGELLCERAGALLQAFHAVEAELREQQKEPAGPIRITATLGFGRLWLGPALADFQMRYPAVSIQLQLTEQLPDLTVEGFDGAIWLWNAPNHRASEWVSRRLASNSGEMVRDWCLAGQGIMLRSLWDIAPQLDQGPLVRVLPDYAMHDADIHWLAPYRAQVPRRIRLLVDFLAARFGHEPWKLKPVGPVEPPDSHPER